MCVFVSDRKLQRVRRMGSRVLLRAQRNRHVVPTQYFRSFCGACVVLTLANPLVRFYTRSIFFDNTCAENEERSEEHSGAPRVYAHKSPSQSPILM